MRDGRLSSRPRALSAAPAPGEGRSLWPRPRPAKRDYLRAPAGDLVAVAVAVAVAADDAVVVVLVVVVVVEVGVVGRHAQLDARCRARASTRGSA